MKTLLAIVFATVLTAGVAEARPSRPIQNALQIIQVEKAAIYSGRYTHYNPNTVRNVISQLAGHANSALREARSARSRQALTELLASLREEHAYSFRFERYRLASMELLLLNYERFLELAISSEGGVGGGGFDGGGFLERSSGQENVPCDERANANNTREAVLCE